jgi:hypothetical protein
MEKHVLPKIGAVPIQKFDRKVNPQAAELVCDVLRPLWKTMTPTAVKLREHIEATLNTAIAKGHILGDNIASLKGPLKHLLPDPKTFYVTTSHPSLPYQQIGEFMAELRASKGQPARPRSCMVCESPQRGAIEEARARGVSFVKVAAMFNIAATNIARHMKPDHCAPNPPRRRSAGPAPPRRRVSSYVVELLVLTAVRKKQILSLEWSQVDWENKLLVFPWRKDNGQQGYKSGKKTRRDYIVPLSQAAVDVLQAMKDWQDASGSKTDFVFPSNLSPTGRTSRHGYLDETTINTFLKRHGLADIPPHGFRTTFGSWAVDNNFEELDSEMALGHVIGNKVRNVYKRDAHRIKTRGAMMEEWAQFCARVGPLPAKVVPIRSAK